MYQLALDPPPPGRIARVGDERLAARNLRARRAARGDDRNAARRPARAADPAGAHRGAESVDLWLATEYRYLPVRIRFYGRDGEPTGEQIVTEIRLTSDYAVDACIAKLARIRGRRAAPRAQVRASRRRGPRATTSASTARSASTDRAFVAEAVFGVLRHKRVLDHLTRQATPRRLLLAWLARFYGDAACASSRRSLKPRRSEWLRGSESALARRPAARGARGAAGLGLRAPRWQSSATTRRSRSGARCRSPRRSICA